MRLYCLLILLFVLSSTVLCQKRAPNHHRYVIVKSSFDFLKQVDRYKTSSFTKFLFDKAGFAAYLDNEELPLDLLFNQCDAVYVDVKDASNLFNTKNYIQLQDCDGNVLFTSNEGVSKLKEYERVYRQAIRNAFASIEELNVVYNTILDKIRAKNLVDLNDRQKESKNGSNVLSDAKDENNRSPKIDDPAPTGAAAAQPANLLYAKKTENGYRLTDRQGLITFALLNTSKQAKFIIEDRNGILEYRES